MTCSFTRLGTIFTQDTARSIGTGRTLQTSGGENLRVATFDNDTSFWPL